MVIGCVAVHEACLSCCDRSLNVTTVTTSWNTGFRHSSVVTPPWNTILKIINDDQLPSHKSHAAIRMTEQDYRDSTDQKQSDNNRPREAIT